MNWKWSFCSSHNLKLFLQWLMLFDNHSLKLYQQIQVFFVIYLILQYWCKLFISHCVFGGIFWPTKNEFRNLFNYYHKLYLFLVFGEEHLAYVLNLRMFQLKILVLLEFWFPLLGPINHRQKLSFLHDIWWLGSNYL